MGTALSEPCIYDKLAESVHVLRQSGYRYGMSEREIEKFIKQVLETNEPRRDPVHPPLLHAVAKVVLLVGVVLVLVLVFTYPQSFSQTGSVGDQNNWSSPLSHTRLLSLPIAKKYNLHSFHAWWSVFGSHTVLNCSGCAGVTSVQELTTLSTTTVPTGALPVLVKGGESLCLQRQHLEELYSTHSSSLSVLMEEEEEEEMSGMFPRAVANFSLLWRFGSGSRSRALRSLLPDALHSPLLESVGSTLRRCTVTHSTGSQSTGVRVVGWVLVGDGSPTVRVFPLQPCQAHCSSFNIWLEPGDLVYADGRVWQLEVFPGRGENVLCDGSAL